MFSEQNRSPLHLSISSPFFLLPYLAASRSACDAALNVTIWIVIEINDGRTDTEQKGKREVLS